MRPKTLCQIDLPGQGCYDPLTINSQVSYMKG